ncbi:isochorismatase family protein [Amycolatopsis acidiphila]|jgi:nicotinamidase-related amidase|uniref:Isochorismatase family protein n=1 Tax=Amycolatopsis acidiphila TaxID=715473 RepID=A0A558AFD7_9PSEU|nr:isochorismatase family protein [Amycolatopsis acidiphila]TVT22974.1 isochorismatase family protein [Amycolatopsis acidiphila]UIJ57136.1 isochorismatase family protein [Amycolatopsis acidiphila]GHG53148.1 N-carbamoylsarcosine amidase [Amycolatopsis acidiphila]
MRVWERFLTDRDRAVFSASGYGTFLGLGERPAVLVIDVNYAFVGHERQPILESIKHWHTSCGEEGWDALGPIAELLAGARARNLPVFYTTGSDPRPDGLGRGLWRNSRGRERSSVPDVAGNDIVAQIAPQERDVLIRKTKPSAFFGTPLMSYLTELGVDSLIVVGTTTSGCVRASVIDAFSHNLRVAIVEEGTFDRGEASHAINLFDMNAKYADVTTLADTLAYLEKLPDDLFAGKIAPAGT